MKSKIAPAVYSLGPDSNEWSLGPDGEVTEYFKNSGLSIKYIVYWYQNGGYDGTGWACIKLSDNSYRTIYLGHCSCYGAFDISEKSDSYHQPMTLDQVYKDLEDCGLETDSKTVVLQQIKKLERKSPAARTK